jgi:hypothetical protein
LWPWYSLEWQSVRGSLMTLGNMRQQGVRSVAVTSWILMATLSVAAQTNTPSSTDDVIKRVRESFRTAKDQQAVENIKIFCKTAIDNLTFREQNRLLEQVIKLTKENKPAEVNATVERLKELDEANAKLASAVCKP